jgi:signal transduction histidine kinase/CheY-like chemotaxis protein
MRVLETLLSHADELDRSTRGPQSLREACSATLLFPREASKQRLRVRRFWLASAFSLLYLVVLAAFYTQGKVDGGTLIASSAIVVALILVFFAAFRSGANLRFGDPSLTAPQVLAAVLTMLLAVYRAPDTRLVFAAFFLVALMFGMLRATGRQLTILGTISLVAFAAVTIGRHAVRHDIEQLRLDMLQLLVMAIAFPWCVFIGSRIKQLREADRRKDDFLATLAHELRNPLAPIRTGIDILRMTGADSQARPVLPMMERQLTHLTRLLDDLLDVSRISRSKVRLHVERVDLRHTVEAAIETSRPLIEEMGHELTASLPSEPLWVDADPVRLAQVLSNLLNNAAKYTPAGGKIALKAERLGDEVEVRVRDNGLGIPRERLDSIFDMFTQLESPVSNLKGGLGIGLSLAKGLVALHRGTIEARSDGPGRGSEFRVRLPAGASRATDAVHEQPLPTRRAKLSIVVVDDNRDAAASLATVLELMGHEVSVAHDGESAIPLANEVRPQAMLVDLGMPGIDGYETCRRIRSEPWGESMRMIAVTGWGQDEDRRKSAIAGFDEHLVKPVNPDTLVELLGDANSRP